MNKSLHYISVFFLLLSWTHEIHASGSSPEASLKCGNKPRTNVISIELNNKPIWNQSEEALYHSPLSKKIEYPETTKQKEYRGILFSELSSSSLCSIEITDCKQKYYKYDSESETNINELVLIANQRRRFKIASTQRPQKIIKYIKAIKIYDELSGKCSKDYDD